MIYTYLTFKILYTTIGLSIISLPIIFKNRENCIDDNDCPFIMRCCKLGIEYYCCSPNNYINLEPLYLYNTIQK